MATLDTSTLTDSAQIFTSYTLPQIRAIHKSLHVQIDEKSARLRTQVGNSYRELLGTADTIVYMRGEMIKTQEILGRMGGLCGRTVVGGKIAGLGKLRGREETEMEMGQVARLRLLKACGLAVRRLLKGPEEGRGDRLVLAAKVLVFIRLLVSSFGDDDIVDEETQDAVEAAKKSLRGLRERLRRSVEKALTMNIDELSSTVEILKALSAYSLASSSGARDVLWYFLKVRAEAIAYEFDFEEHKKDRGTENVLHGLSLYTRTLLDVQSLVPSKLPQALSALKKKPLLADESLQSLEGLRLDIYERWCGEDIQYFTPFIRHDDLDSRQAREMLTDWAKKGGDTLLSGLGKTLEHVSEFKTIVELRTSVLQQWIRDGGKARGFDPSVMLDGLREAINDRLLNILQLKVMKLKLVGSEIVATLDAWHAGKTDEHRNLWDEDTLDLDISSGANHVALGIVSRLYGRNDAVSRAVTGFESWHHIMDNVGDLVEQLRRQRWDNDVDEIEDEDVIETRQKLLSRDDPQLLHERLDTTLAKAFKDLDHQVAALWRDRRHGADSGQVATYILRILRDIRGRLPELGGAKTFGLDIVPSLYEKLALHVSTFPLEEFSTTTLIRKRVAGRALWEGEPALPAQPSPGAFRLLRNLVMSMSDAGLDLWTPTAVRMLKYTFSMQLVETWREEVQARTKPAEAKEQKATADKEVESEAGGYDILTSTEECQEVAPVNHDSSPTRTGQRDVLTQWLYDIHLLKYCLGTDGASRRPLDDLAGEILKKVEMEEGEAEDRLAKSSQEYWKRTSLLFGLLA